MYFQIENTPERIQKARRAKNVSKESPKEVCPRLILAPFSRPPQVIFDNVHIGYSCERELEVFNPSKQTQQITLGKVLPPGLEIHLPGEWLELEPETCYCLSMTWTPTQPTAMRETIRFTNENRGRYDVVVVLKTVKFTKGKNQSKGFKTSPGKIKKKVASKKSPVAIYKKKAELIYNTTKVKAAVNIVQPTQHNVYQTFNKENISRDDYSINSYADSKCPFDSPSSINFNFNTTEIFSNMKKTNVLQETYDKSYNITNNISGPHNVLKPSNKQNCDVSATDIFDNLTFTPLKSLPAKAEKLDKGPKIILSVNSESDLEDSLETKTTNKENETHSIISITSAQPPNKWLTVNHTHIETQHMETPTLQNKKHPNTSSPKELNSPNFSINTDFSRISELSFFPQRFSTERKCFAKNDTHEILDEKLCSDTYTKDSPVTPMEQNIYQMNMERPPHFFNREQPKMCRQSLFREYQQQKETNDKNLPKLLSPYDHNVWQFDLRADVRSPPRSITPPLQSIPEESIQLSETHIFNKTDKQLATFTLDRTFDKPHEKSSMSTNNRQTWSKRAIGVEADLWKIPVQYVKKIKSKNGAKSKDSIGSKMSDVTFETNKSIKQNITINQTVNVYSQSSTVDPFLSATYFYDEEAVGKFETEFKRWLNCILTPPADLDSNVEQKIDVGKAWIENRNKEVPLAPTKEQVCSAYHNSHRLESLRRAARNLLRTPEMAQVFLKLNAQIDKKLIAVRADRNLHLDVGLQKVIMELILSYNPLWLRIGLEAIYGVILPLKSNSDIEGLTTFVIQRMFKNPYLKNKHSKSSAPNMLLPAYMDAIKKFTLKRFFMLVFFLDQAKQRKLISHDPCLFCRNAVCKESREVIIRFTRELIAGIGDITKHLRPIGYVVSQKQSYLDEYKFAVHNLAVDIRDGVRLSKVMEIILMKNGLMTQLRTPAISRLQKIHNVQVGLSALKEANFVIVGDITATDIADGHREKTLSLLWQLIHVFRAPLFVEAANVIQTWWRKKFEVIMEKRKEEEKVRLRLSNAVIAIQCWWRRIQYNRQVELKIQQITRATIVVQKYWRMWLCRTRLRRCKSSVLKIEDWFRSVQMMRAAKITLQTLRIDREQLKNKCATNIQSYIKRWLCMKRYKRTVQKIVIVQSLVRRFIIRKQYVQLKKSVIYIQQKYRSKLLMRLEMQKHITQKRSVLIIQSYYRMIKQRKTYLNLKKSVQIIENRYIALMKMRNERKNYLDLQKSVIALQALYRGKKCRVEYVKKRNSVTFLQRKIRAHQHMKNDRANFLKIKKSATVLQTYIRSYLNMKKVRDTYVAQRKSSILIQRHFRSYCHAKAQRHAFVKLRASSLVLQRQYRSLLLMRKERSAYLKLRKAAIHLQRRYRAQLEMRKCRQSYIELQTAALELQRRYRALTKMREQRVRYQQLRESCMKIQNALRAYVLGKQQRRDYLKQKGAVLKIQNWYRSSKKGREIRQQYEQSKQACVIIQRYYKAFIIGRHYRKEYLRIKTSTLCIQRFYRSYIEMRTTRQEYIKIKTSTVIIQKFYRCHLLAKKQREAYLKMKSAVSCIENTYRRYRDYQVARQSYLLLRRITINVQRRYRSIIAMRLQRNAFLKVKQSVVVIQQKYRALVAMRVERKSFLTLRSAVITIQTRYRAQSQMKQERLKYIAIRRACVCIQRFYRAYILSKNQKYEYLTLKKSTIDVQRRYRALLAMRKERTAYITKKAAAITIQRRLRANNLMLKNRKEYIRTLNACKTIQIAYRAFVAGKRQKLEYMKIRSSVILIQTHFRMLMETRKVRNQYLQLRNTAIWVQRRFRVICTQRNIAAVKIQNWYRSVQKRRREIAEKLREHSAIIIQKYVRRYLIQSWYRSHHQKVLYIQNIWRGKLITRQMRCEYLLKKNIIIKIQSAARGYLVRRNVQLQKEHIIKVREEKKQHWAAIKIQALFRGNKARVLISHDKRVAELRRRWREGALNSSQETLKERNDEALDVIRNTSNIDSIIRAFKCLELITEVYPMMYNVNAAPVVRRVFVYMSATNRSISSVELLKSAAAIMVNLARYKVTGPNIYARDGIQAVLKFMWRFSNSETDLFCILSTYLWLFSKYDKVREDLAEYLQSSENHKMLMTIKGNVDRMSRMVNNTRNKFHTPCKFMSRPNNMSSFCSTNSNSIVMPALEPNYGIISYKPKYFEDAEQAINCLFHTFNL